MPVNYDPLDHISEVVPGSAKSALSHYVSAWNSTGGDVGDDLNEILTNIAGREAEKYARLVAEFIQREAENGEK